MENKDLSIVISKISNFFLQKLKSIKYYIQYSINRECPDPEFRANRKFFIDNLIVKIKQILQIIDFKQNKEQ